MPADHGADQLADFLFCYTRCSDSGSVFAADVLIHVLQLFELHSQTYCTVAGQAVPVENEPVSLLMNSHTVYEAGPCCWCWLVELSLSYGAVSINDRVVWTCFLSASNSWFSDHIKCKLNISVNALTIYRFMNDRLQTNLIRHLLSLRKRYILLKEAVGHEIFDLWFSFMNGTYLVP